MGSIARFSGMIIMMYHEKNEPHSNPHIHVRNQDEAASYNINGTLQEGSIHPQKEKKLKKWMAAHSDELKLAWNDAYHDKPIRKIGPFEK